MENFIHRSFPSKILIFGEYTVLNGGSALAIPYKRYEGKWEKAEETTLDGFFDYLLGLEGVHSHRVELAKKERWQFVSSIPEGYGLGSSGALSAAAFDAFFSPVRTLDELKDKVSLIESYFHGQSSGLDPLTCYTHKAIHSKARHLSQLNALSLPPQIHLYDSGISREGKSLITAYNDRLSHDDKFKQIVTELSQFNDQIISDLIARKDISKAFREISFIQFNHFKEMIPDSMVALWKRGLADESYYMKLSGAGGGGVFLVWVVDEAKTYPDFQKIEWQNAMDIMKLYRYQLWLGKFKSKEICDAFFREKIGADYEDETIPLSPFVGSQGARWVDHDFLEHSFSETNVLQFLKGSTYARLLELNYPEVRMEDYNVYVLCGEEELPNPISVDHADYKLDYIGLIEYNYSMHGRI